MLDCETSPAIPAVVDAIACGIVSSIYLDLDLLGNAEIVFAVAREQLETVPTAFEDIMRNGWTSHQQPCRFEGDC